MIEVIDGGIVPYAEADRWQRELAEQRRCGRIPDTLILLEHPPVITIGRRDSDADFLIPKKILHDQGIEVVKTDRGGRLTYHGPGQLVGYFIVQLKKSIPAFVCDIEKFVIRLLKDVGIEGHCDPQFPGVWVGEKKISALGLHLDRGITRHGFALNVDCDLKPFDTIRPCGIQGRGVTSMKEEGITLSMQEMKARCKRSVLPYFADRLTTLSIASDARMV